MSTTTKTASKENVPRLPSAGQARFAFSVLFLVNILNYADRYVLPAILPKIADPKQGLGLTSFQQGLLGSSFLLVYGIAALPLGVWADRRLRKNIVRLCVGLWSVETVMAGVHSHLLRVVRVHVLL